MENPNRRTLETGWLFLALVVGLVAGIIIGRRSVSGYLPTGGLPAAGNDSNYALIGEAWNKIQSIYVDRTAVDSKRLAYGAITGMVDSLGDTGHSRFLTPEMLRQEQMSTQGSYEGVGIQVDMKDGRVVVVAPIDDTPAQRAGVHAGDFITAVNGESTEGMTLNDVISKVLGPAGTDVTLTLQDPKTNATRDVTLTRAKIVLHSVTWSVVPGTTIAHVRVTSFSNGVSDDLKKALEEIKSQNMTGIILDLRNNPGGLLNESITTTSQFVGQGDVLLTQDANGQRKGVPVEKGGIVTDIPLVVLINKGSASAAEITAGAIQDAGRAKLVGETTFGTGTVLSVFNLSDGSAMLLATEEWLTPKGRVIWHHGIEPDIPVQMGTDVELLSPSVEKTMTADQLKASPDIQFLKALDLLQNR